MWYVWAMEYYSARKKNKIVTFEAIWMDIEIVILSKISEKDKYHITYMWNINK